METIQAHKIAPSYIKFENQCQTKKIIPTNKFTFATMKMMFANRTNKSTTFNKVGRIITCHALNMS